MKFRGGRRDGASASMAVFLVGYAFSLRGRLALQLCERRIEAVAEGPHGAFGHLTAAPLVVGHHHRQNRLHDGLMLVWLRRGPELHRPPLDKHRTLQQLVQL